MKSLIRLLVDFLLYDLTQLILMVIASVFVIFALVGCSGGSSSPSAEGGGSDSPESPKAVSLEVRSGDGFSCFVLAESLFCRRHSGIVPTNGDVAAAVPSESWSLVFSAGSDLEGVWVWDDTVCVGASVSQRPQARDAGSATYCWGEATLAGSYVDLDAVYGGPSFTDGVNDSPELSYDQTPFVGADVSLEYWVNQTDFAEVVTDTDATVASETLSCEISGSGDVLTCPSFEVSL